jgi:hypothetical protein
MRVGAGLSFLVATLIASPVYAISDAQSQSILRLGELNGIALQCHYLKPAREIKLSLAQSLPKQRALGDMFESETNRSFLEFINRGEACPGEATIQDMVDKAIVIMHQQFQQPR